MLLKAIASVLGVLTLLACSGSDKGGGSVIDGAGGADLNSGGGGSGNTDIVTVPRGGMGAIDVGNGTGGMAGSDSTGVMNGVCAQQDFNLNRLPAEILLVLDRSGSMRQRPAGMRPGTPTKWELVVPGLTEVVTSTDATVSWGLKVFPEGGAATCDAASVTGAIPVAVAAANAKPVTDEIAITTPMGNGTPTSEAINAATAYLKTLTSPNPKFILLATDGEPSCVGTVAVDVSNDPMEVAAATMQAAANAVQSVTDAASAGFKTFVVGVATTAPAATQALNDMAVAGQMPRVDPAADPAATKYYLANSQVELVEALKTITGQVSGCVFTMKAAPPDPSNIAVKVNDMSAPHDPTHMSGWDYTSSEYTQVEVYGTWCEQIKAAGSNTVNFVLGCPGEDLH